MVRPQCRRFTTPDSGYVRHGSDDDPEYEIKSDKTDHVAMHKGRALRHHGPACMC
jgi:hypothetical protein